MKKLVGYITAAFPDKNFTIDLAFKLAESGVDTIELGIPFSDPVADGPVIEQANLLALQNGFKLADLFEISQKIGPKIDTLWMGYMNPFYHKGFEFFLQEAKKYEISGMIIPDLPHEEAKKYKPLFEQYDKNLIEFIAPTDSQERIHELAQNAKKFIYLVAYAGITGSAKEENLDNIIANIKQISKTPVYIGFGVDEKTAKQKAQSVDGVIVGSAFVKYLIDESLSNSEKISKICKSAQIIKNEINS